MELLIPFYKTHYHLLRHLADTLDARAVQVTVVLASLDEPMALDVLLHLLPGGHKVIVSPIHLVLPLGPRGVCETENKKSVPRLEMPCADVTLILLHVAAVTLKRKTENASVSVTDSVITYVGHKIQTYQGTQTTGHHLSCPSRDPE